MIISTLVDLTHFLSDSGTHETAAAYLQGLMDEEYQFNETGSWGIASNTGLSRLGLTRTEAVALGATDRCVPEPDRTVNLDAAKQAACSRIDAIAEGLRNTVLTPGSGQMATYQAKQAQAEALLRDAAPTEADYPDIFNEVGITADTAHDVAMAVLTAAETWRLFGRAVEKARLAGKKNVVQASDMAGLATAEAAVSWPSLG